MSPNKNEIDLSNEVLNTDFGQETTKISEVKVRGKKNSDDWPSSSSCARGRQSWQIFFSNANFDL